MGAVLAIVAVAGIVGVTYLVMQNQQSSNGASMDSEGSSGDFNQAIPADSTDSSTVVAPGIMALARGIARGEGFLVSGSLSQRSHNPGDLTKSFGNAVTGVANKEGVLIFATLQDGWNALYSQLALIFAGNSKAYNLDMTILEFAATWTLGRAPRTREEQQSVSGWAVSVLEELNKTAEVANAGALSADSTLGDISV